MAVLRSADSVTVLVDATSIPAVEGGVARYLRGLIAGLSGHQTEVRLHVVCKRRDAAWVRATHVRAIVHVGPQVLEWRVTRLIWEQLALPFLARRIGAHVIHSPHYTMPLFTRVATVVTVHDATFFSMPELHARVKGSFFRMWCRISARRATVIVGPSNATRNEFQKYTGVSGAGFVTALHGVSHARFFPPSAAEVESFATKYGLESASWIAFLGTIEPRKNLPNLIHAFERLLSAHSTTTQDLQLILVGESGWDHRVDQTIAPSPFRSRIRRLGYLDDDELRAFLGGSACMAYPSLGEGFGLPVLEAMACGAAVLTTSSLALPEVGGDAVMYRDSSVESIESGLRELVTNVALRAELSAKAVERAKTFTWERSADAHVGAYNLARGRRAAAKPARRRFAT